jgi:hypothetical protein
MRSGPTNKVTCSTSTTSIVVRLLARLARVVEPRKTVYRYDCRKRCLIPLAARFWRRSGTVRPRCGISTPVDPWKATLRKLKGRVGIDGIERISTTDVFDALEVPMRRRPSLTLRLSGLIRRLGWSNIRARGLNPGSYRDRVRGFAREVPGHPATIRSPNDY